jgi:hypothetical protein
MIAEHDQVVLTHDLPRSRLCAGDVGFVVHVHPSSAAYEVEFVSLDGETIAVETLSSSAVRAVRPGDMAHVRPLTT